MKKNMLTDNRNRIIPLILGIMLGMAIMGVLSFTSPSPVVPPAQSFYKTGTVGSWVIYESNSFIIVGNSQCVAVSTK